MPSICLTVSVTPLASRVELMAILSIRSMNSFAFPSSPFELGFEKGHVGGVLVRQTQGFVSTVCPALPITMPVRMPLRLVA